jgi:selenium metabolism protein YedF
MTEVDARGLSCPQPVILAKRALAESAGAVDVIVDNDVARQNVERMADSQGWNAQSEKRGDDIHVLLTKGEAVSTRPVARDAGVPAAACAHAAVFITSHVFGTGDEELGRVLMRSFIKTLKELDPLPKQLVFANAGVRLTTEGSDLIDDIAELERSGVEVLSCGTCLDYYELTNVLRVGVASNMYQIVTSLFEADKVLKL